MLRYLWMLAVVPLGCGHGFDRVALHSRLRDDSFQINEAAIAKVMALKPQLQFPCNVAVYLKPSDSCDWRWTAKDKEILKGWADLLRQDGIEVNLFMISDMFAGAGDLKSLRVAAARYGADVLLVIRGAEQNDRYENVASALNLTVVGGYVVPGSHCDSLFLMQAAMIDVGNEFIYASVESEGTASIVRPTFIIEESVAVKKAKQEALQNLGPELIQRIRNLRAQYAPTGASSPPPVRFSSRR